MKVTPLLMALMMSVSASAAEPDTRVYEMRTYYAAPGQLDSLLERFRQHTCALFEKHSMTNLGYWVPITNPEGRLISVLAYPSRQARDTAWKNLQADPDWIKQDSEKDGPLVARVESLFLQATDFSPPIQASKAAEPRVFELRTYTTPPGRLDALHERFRNHTLELFKKHGMTNLFYWQPTPDQPAAGQTLVYLLAHASEEAAKTSFLAFRADPAWIAAKNASEQKAGGSLTIPDGVVSLFLKPTDFSPTR